MKNRFHPVRIFGIIFILLVVLVILFVSRRDLSTGKAFQAIGPSSATTTLACDGDIVCEMNGANVLQTLISGGVVTNRLTVTGNAFVSGDYVNAGSLSTASMKVLMLTGKGNAYACLDSLGNLYRSSKPCV